MRRNPDFLLRVVAGTNVVVPIGMATENFAGMINLNASGVFLWNQLETDQTPETLAEALTREYEVDMTRARMDVNRFLERLIPTGAILDL